MADWLVVFGAAVRADGTPSGSLARRLEGALAAGRALADPHYFVSGGQGREGPAEAKVMADWLAAQGVPRDRVQVDDRSTDTLETVRACTAALRPLTRRLTVCSSGYHNPRCALLLALSGFQVHVPRMPPDRPALGWPKFAFYVLRETVALPWDALLLLVRRTP
jgi:uncharacterized SAM-binding protein YcdF (DUF218 family)